jgi:hypothetical protein
VQYVCAHYRVILTVFYIGGYNKEHKVAEIALATGKLSGLLIGGVVFVVTFKEKIRTLTRVVFGTECIWFIKACFFRLYS